MHITHSSVVLTEAPLWQLITITRATINIVMIVMTMMRTIATAPPIIGMVLFWSLVNVGLSVVCWELGEWDGGDGSQSPSSVSDAIATEHFESTVISTPVTMILAPPLTHSPIREMSEPLSVSEVATSLARYVAYVGDLG